MTNPTPTRAEVEALIQYWVDVCATEETGKTVEILRAYAATLPPQPVPVVEGKPTSAEINALPQRIRNYIAALETECDPAGTIRENFRLREENAGLRALDKERAEGKPTLTPEMRDFLAEAQQIWCDCGSPQCSCRVSEPARRLVPRIATALAAEAQKAALEADARVAEMREACIREFLIRHAVNQDQADFANAILRGIRALPSPSSDRFIRLLEEARELEFGPYTAHGQRFVIIVTRGNIDKFKEALAAFRMETIARFTITNKDQV